MTDFRTLKQSMYCSPIHVRALLDVFERQVEDQDGMNTNSQEIPDAKIEQHIQNADSIIAGWLIGPYGEAALDSETPYFTGPITPEDTPSTVSLRGVIVAATAITEQWLVRFTAKDAFEVIGTVSGAQGTGTVGADFTSTNMDVQIKSEDWDLGTDGAVDEGCQVVFATCKSKRLVRTLSAKLAAADLIDALYSDSSDEQPQFSRALRKQAMDLLKALIDPKLDVSLTQLPDEETDFAQAIDYTISVLGDDVSDYGAFTDDKNPLDY